MDSESDVGPSDEGESRGESSRSSSEDESQTNAARSRRTGGGSSRGRGGRSRRPPYEPLLTIDEVAHWLGKPKNTLYRWRKHGYGPRAIKVGNDLRYRVAEVERFLNEQTDYP
jgi:predicted DNA-binding transcriptional regulator AlpA